MVKDAFTRRRFVTLVTKGFTVGVLALAGELPFARRIFAEGAADETPVPPQWKEKEWFFLIDVEKCIGCASCVTACKKENGVPLDQDVYRTWVERYLVDSNEKVRIDSPRGGVNFSQLDIKPEKQFFVPKLCNQCHNAPCIQVCPVGATYKTGDGVVLVDRKRCIGCRYCIQACPYGARFLHPDLKVADKCTWCYHRISNGMPPACVQICPTGARKFGNLKDPESEVVKLKKQARTRVLKPDMGTKPNLYYLALDEVVK